MIRVYDLRKPAPPKSTKTLTVEMIDGDGYGGNLSGPYSERGIRTILAKTEEYNRLSGESNDPDKLIFRYRLQKLGLWKTLRLLFRERRYRRLRRLTKKIASDPYINEET